MWFKNLQIYRFTKPFIFTADEIAVKLEENSFKPCGSQETSSYGWVTPLGRHGQEYIHAANGYIMICAKRQEKILPAGVINEKVAEQIQFLEEKENRKLSRKEKTALKEEIQFELLPKAFVRSKLQFAYLSPKENLLIINSSSANRAEELINCLRDALGTVPVIPFSAKNIPIQTMTHWLLNSDLPADFDFGSECSLANLQEEGSQISYKQLNLLSNEINSHLKSGMIVRKLALSFQQRIEFVLDDKLSIKKLKFGDLIQELSNNENADDAAQQFDVDFSIMTAELSNLIAGLIEAFGGDVQT